MARGNLRFPVDINLAKQQMTEVHTSPAFPRSQLVDRVAHYESVSQWLQTAKDYYSSAKEKNSLLRYGCTKIESNLETVKNVAQSSTVLKLASPILTTADSLGCIGLDQLEKFNETYKPVEKVDQLKKNASDKVYNMTESGMQFVETRVVNPVDDYLKNSILSYPLGFALESTNKLIDVVLPGKTKKEAYVYKEEKTEEGDVFPDVSPFQFPSKKEKTPEIGPIHRAGQISKKTQERIFQKLRHLKMRSPDAVAAMHHCVDLINYAANHIDSGIQQIRSGPVAEKVTQVQHQISVTRDNAVDNIKSRVTRARDTLQDATQVVKSIPAVIASKAEELRSKDEQEAIPPHMWLTSPTPQQLLDTTIDASNIAVSVLRTLSADLRSWFIQNMRTPVSASNPESAALSEASASHLQIVKNKLQDTVTLLNSVLQYLHVSSASTPSKNPPRVAAKTTPRKAAKSSPNKKSAPSSATKLMKTSTSLLPVDSEASEELPVAPMPIVESQETFETYKDALEHGLEDEQEEGEGEEEGVEEEHF